MDHSPYEDAGTPADPMSPRPAQWAASQPDASHPNGAPSSAESVPGDVPEPSFPPPPAAAPPPPEGASAAPVAAAVAPIPAPVAAPTMPADAPPPSATPTPVAAPPPSATPTPAGVSSLPTLDELLKRLVELDGSDLHLKVGSPPAYRIDGTLHLAELPKLTPADTADFAEQVMPDHVREIFAEQNEADFAYGQRALGRFRVNCYRQRGSINVVLRSVTPVTKTFDELGLPPSVEKLANSEWGLVIVNGRAGTGKSTTLGALIDYVNGSRRANIITLEDPIEILHADKLSIVSQREIGLDTKSYAEGMRRALRQDADVIFMGEMRDRETMEAAMQAAETGKLILTSMLTADAIETVTRIVESFPPFQQRQVRATLVGVMRGIVSHRLVPRADGRGRALAAEILVNNDRVHERIMNPELTHQLLDAMVDGGYYGMQSFDQALLKLLEKGTVTFQDALAHATDPTDFKLAAQALGVGG